MSVIWKRLQRVNKRAAKYRVIFELQELMVEGTSQWQPTKLSVVLTRRRRRISSQPMHWEPTIRNPYRGLVVWSLPEILDVDVTLYRGMRSQSYEDKEWTLAIEDISPLGRPRRIATANINISSYVDEQFAVPSRHEFFKLSLNLTSKKVKEVYVTLMMSTQFLKAGKATDYDMESVTSMMSVSANDGVQNLDDDEVDIGEHSAETSAQIFEIANKFSELLNNEGGEEEEADNKRLTDSPPGELDSAPFETYSESAVKDNGQVEEDSAHNHFLAANRDEDPSPRQSSSDKTSPSGTFASSAESPSAVINFKANTISTVSTSRQSAPDSGRVTHSRGQSALHSATKSANHDAANTSLIAPNSADLGRSVYSRSDESQHRKLPSHVAKRDTNADLRSRASDFTTGKAHTESVTVASKARRADNRPKWTGPNLDESAFRGDRFLSSPDRDTEQMPVYSAAEELLSWCRQVTEGYHGVKITNMTTSWRNGMAFCAIIHHFQPDLIDFDSLKPNEVVRNCSMAFEAAFSLGIPKIIEANDMIALTVPDRLSVMTYLYQLKSYFSGQTPLLSKANSYTLSRYNELEEECEEEDSAATRNISEIKSKCLDLFDCLDELDNAAYMHKLQNATSTTNSTTSITAPTTSQMTTAYQQKLQSHNWNDYLDNTRNNNHSKSRPVSIEGFGNNNVAEQNGRQVDLRNRLMTRKQLMNPFDSDSDEEIELISKSDSKQNHWASTPSSSSTDSEENSLRSKTSSFVKEPIRKPLQFAASSLNYQNDAYNRTSPRPLPTSYSTSSFPMYRFSTNNTSSVHSGLSKMANEPVEVAPGLLDLTSVKAYRLQRAFSAPTCHSFLVDLRKRPQFREEELRERARQLLENVRNETTTKHKDASRSSNTSSLSREQEERQRVLRERARKLIADARQGIIAGSNLDSPVSMASNSTTNSTNTPVMSPLDGLSTFDAVDAACPKYLIKSDFDKTKMNNSSEVRPSLANNDVVSNKGTTEINGNENNWTANKPTDRVGKRGVMKSKSGGKVDYTNIPDSFESVQHEIESIEKQQKQIDSEAAILEKRLRKIMDTGGNKRLEEKLIQNWFVLVNKRNALIRRQMQLNIREKEADMNRRYEELNQELRTLVSIDDSIKTDAQRAREKKLLDDLVQIVDKRDELVRHLDNQEKAIEEDELVENETQRPIRIIEDNEKNCVIQ